MSVERKTFDEIAEYTKELKLPGIRQCLKEEVEKAFEDEMSYDLDRKSVV